MRQRFVLPWFIIAPMLGGGCATDTGGGGTPIPPGTGDVGGGVTRGVLNLPVADRTRMLCTQGVGGEHSHHFRSTRNAVDLDTPNDRDQAVYAPSSGIARVHDDPASPFGIHVNVDRLDGTYAVIAHLKRVIVKDGAEVAEGTLIGIEGCTGACSGDHVHLSLMEGDASQGAEHGISIPMSLILRDEDGEMDLLDAAQLDCGVSDGTRYASALAAVNRHPDGSLVQVSGDPRVYQLDGGMARHVVDEQAFMALGYDFRDVVLIAEEEFACYEQGAAIGSAADLAWTPVAGLTVGTLTREASRSDVYAVTAFGLMPVEDWRTLLLLGYDPARIRFVADGTFARSGLPMGDCVSGFGCITRALTSTCAAPFAFGASEDGGIGGPVDEQQEEEEEDDGTQDGEDDESPDEGEQDAPADRDVPADGGNEDGTEDDGGSAQGAGAPGAPRALHVSWTAPFSAPAARITLSGEYHFADGSYGFFWHELAEVANVATLAYDLDGVGSGDAFRFSVEFEALDGDMSWSCIGPYDASQGQYGTRQGTAVADVDGTAIAIQTNGDPSGETTGCGLNLIIP